MKERELALDNFSSNARLLTYFKGIAIISKLNLIDEWRAAKKMATGEKADKVTSKCIPSLVKLYISESRFSGVWIDDT